MENYKFIRQLGKGAFGSVSLVKRRKDRKLVALKMIKILGYQNMSQQEKQNSFLEIKNEIDLLRRVSSEPNCYKYISCYYDSFIDKEKGIVYLEMEYIKGFTSREYIEGVKQMDLSEEEKKDVIVTSLYKIIEAIALALQHIHNLGILHLDIKPENIIIEAKTATPKLVDFGLSCITKSKNSLECQNVEQCCESKGGTLEYTAPEIVFSSYHILYPKSDVFSLGATIYSLLTDETVWNMEKAVTYREKLDEIKKQKIPNKLDIEYTKLNYLVNSMLDHNLFRRFGTKEILNFLKTEF